MDDGRRTAWRTDAIPENIMPLRTIVGFNQQNLFCNFLVLLADCDYIKGWWSVYSVTIV